jgi:hypothetical protein
VKPWTLRWAPLFPLTLLACGGEFPPGSRITSARLLSVRADAPYAAPGAEIHLEALAYDPEKRALSFGWGTCPNPTATTVLGCLDEMDASTFRAGSDLSTFDLVIPADALDPASSTNREQASVGVVVVVCPGDLTLLAPAPHILQTGTLPFVCSDRDSGRKLASDEFVVGLKRVFVRATDHNANPSIEGVTFDGVDWPSDEVKTVRACPSTGYDYKECEAQGHDIAPIVPARVAEQGSDAFGLSYSEQVIVQYYASSGVWKDDLRIVSAPGTRWAGQRSNDGSVTTLWIVVRDDRGGVSWTHRRVQVE